MWFPFPFITVVSEVEAFTVQPCVETLQTFCVSVDVVQHPGVVTGHAVDETTSLVICTTVAHAHAVDKLHLKAFFFFFFFCLLLLLLFFS